MRPFAFALLSLAFAAGCDDDGGGAAPSVDVGGGPLLDLGAEPDLGATDAGEVEADAAPEADAAREVDGGPSEGNLTIEPVRSTLELGDGPPPTVQYTVTRAYADREPEVLDPSDLAWTVEPPELGAIDDAGRFTSAGVGGSVTIIVRDGRDEARAFVELVSFEDVLVGEVPADAPERFASAPVGEDCAPGLRYPEPLTALPRNIAGLRFMWRGEGHDLFRVEFEAGGLTIRWFTADDWLVPEGEPWEALLRAAAGGALRATITGLGGAGDAACATPGYTFEIDRSALQGAIYYWSTTDAGIMRLATGEVAPEPFLTPAVAPQINCPACHALSRDGTRIAFARTTFPPMGDLVTSNVDDPTQLLYDPAQVPGAMPDAFGVRVRGYFPSFAPDNERVVGGADGQLAVRSVTTGEVIETLPMPQGKVGGSPDWSWQGEAIVGAYADGGLANPLPNVGINGGEIAIWRLMIDQVSWAEPEVLVPRVDERWNDRPAFSPDGERVAFNRIGPNPNPDDDSMGNPNQNIWIVPAAGGMAVELRRANKEGMLGNSWPKWAPNDFSGDRIWLAFSSVREYGDIVNQGERPQLWVTGIRRDAEPGEDPSAPAFWLPYQNSESGNHIPYWAVYDKE